MVLAAEQLLLTPTGGALEETKPGNSTNCPGMRLVPSQPKVLIFAP